MMKYNFFGYWNDLTISKLNTNLVNYKLTQSTTPFVLLAGTRFKFSIFHVSTRNTCARK